MVIKRQSRGVGVGEAEGWMAEHNTFVGESCNAVPWSTEYNAHALDQSLPALPYIEVLRL